MVLHDDDNIWYGFDDATMWLIGVYILYDDEMSWGHSDGYVVLRVLIDGPVIEAAYGQTMIHSTEAIWEILALKE